MGHLYEWYEQGPFSQDQQDHIVIVESRLISLTDDLEVLLEESDPTQVRGIKSWERIIPVEFDSERVSLNFDTYWDDEDPTAHYFVSHSWNVGSESDFVDIIPLKTEDLEEALSRLQKYIGFVKDGYIPPEYLPEQNVWKERDCGGVPKRFVGQVPLWQVIKSCELRRKRARLTVNLGFDGTDEWLDVIYDGPKMHEKVVIKDGKMLNATSKSHEDVLIDYGRMNISIAEKISSFEKTYYIIKSFEDKLRELPWQDDLQAIYQGNGIL